MKVLIENYRGWEILFDTQKESFYCHSEQYDTDKNKQSYSSVKNFIDDFIKENQVFKPVVCELKHGGYGSGDMIKLIGIRKDGRFIYEGAKGEKKQLPAYHEGDYILYNPENETYKISAAKIYEKIEALRLERNEILKQIKGVELVDYKKQFMTPSQTPDQ